MTETTATTGTSARSVETKSADASAFTDEATNAEPDASAGEVADSAESDGTGSEATAESNSADAGDSAESTADPESAVASQPETDEWAESRTGGESVDAAASERPPTNRPTFIRPPGMVPPPDHPQDGAERTGVPVTASLASGGFSTAYASAPVSAPPRVTGQQLGGGGGGMPPSGSEPTDSAVGSARVGEPMRSRVSATPRGPRRARLHLKRVDPWSVMKFSFAVSLVLFVVVIVAASVLYLALDTMGVFASINNTVAELISSGGGDGADTFRITAQGVIGTAAVLGALNVLLFTSLATLGAFIYNVCADLVGGVEVTLAERD